MIYLDFTQCLAKQLRIYGLASCRQRRTTTAFEVLADFMWAIRGPNNPQQESDVKIRRSIPPPFVIWDMSVDSTDSCRSEGLQRVRQRGSSSVRIMHMWVAAG